MAEADSYLMVAGIDFGTTFSGYGFSFKTAIRDIKLNKNWGDSQGFLSYKTPTSVLLDHKGNFEAFGFKAEQLYIEGDDDDDERGAASACRSKQLHRNFKMMLHTKKKITTTSTVCSADGQLFPAITVFTFALRYLKDNLIEEMSKELTTSVDIKMIRWVITVPAIWSEESKQFMREAAFRAGCISTKDSKQLIIALEPEAASFFCRHLDLAKFANSEGISFPSGTRYLVLDCGGGTNDMVVHEVILDYKIKEICAINGGAQGGNRVNEKFIDLLKEILGAGIIQSFQKDEPEQWFNFISKFERSKKTIENDGKSKIKVELPYSLPGKYASLKQGNSLKKTLNDAKDKGISFATGSIVLSHETVKTLFKETIQHIVEGVKGVFDNDAIDQIDYIFMVGGFCESKFLQQAIKDTFEQEGCQVLVPHEAQLAIIKGAVLYGHYQDQVVSRIARNTYGADCVQTFNHEIHDKFKFFINEDGMSLCDSIFWPLVQMGDEIQINSSVETSFGLTSKQTTPNISLYSINRKSKKPVEYTDAADVSKLGTIRLDTPDITRGKSRRVNLKITFGNTEILAEAIETMTGNTASTTIDFLS